MLLVGGIDSEFVSVVNKLKGLNLGCDWLARYLSDRKTYNWRRILETMKLLDKVGFKEEKLSSLLKAYPDLVGPRAVWNRFKIGRDELCQIIKEEPLRLFSIASKTNKGRIELDSLDWRNAEKTTFLLKLGYVENSDEMVRALKKFQGRGDELQERFDCFVKAGLDYNVLTTSETWKFSVRWRGSQNMSMHSEVFPPVNLIAPLYSSV
ncbi:hypothetical protein AXX17_AT5G43330 [Arabidopsis thaliana]|uniref:Mitochondrial transcription termination factor family protein n=1 Tax=Arabidopsis thaliana TaxID=3702 RepID=A0A178ULG3_ARATH|nr:hypothetical protein AXX17_AT5G43330 [Arabidopsis thaliana]